MEIRVDEGQETELNMTPMIDIVFQLIIFFLLSLKFKTIDRRIESMLPKDRGPGVVVTFPADELAIKFKLFRRDLASPEAAYTLIRLGNARQFMLPKGWKGRAQEGAARLREYDAVLASIRASIEERIVAYGGIASGVKGEIVAPPPGGGAVPHGDVVAVLDAFLEAGVTEVKFEGTASPLTTRERAARASGK